MIRSVLDSLAIPVIEAEGFEADDVLATLATEARDRWSPGDRRHRRPGLLPARRGSLHAGALQPRGVSDYSLYDEAGIEERTGVRPDKYPCWPRCAATRPTTFPGVPGVGEKTAAKLVNEYGDLDTFYAHLDALSPKLRENLAAKRRAGPLNAELIPLVRDVPLSIHVGPTDHSGDGTSKRPGRPSPQLRVAHVVAAVARR